MSQQTKKEAVTPAQKDGLTKSEAKPAHQDFDSFWDEEINSLKNQDISDWSEVVESVTSAVIKRLNLPDTEEIREQLKYQIESDESIKSVLKREFQCKE